MGSTKQDKQQIEDNTERYEFDGPLLQDIQRVVAQELLELWRDLGVAAHTAINHKRNWSKNCVRLEERIKLLTPLVGPTLWTQVDILLLEFGIYQRIHEEIGIAVHVDMEKVAEARAMVDTNDNS